MPDEPRETIDRAELLTLIGQVRGRWRFKLALRGVAFVLGVGFAALLTSAYGLEVLRFRPAAIIGFRVGLFAALIGLVAWFLIRPLRRRVTDEQVALYLEEHEPSLQAAILSAIDSTTAVKPAATESPALVRRLVEQAVQKCREEDLGRRVEQRRLRHNWFGLGGRGRCGRAAAMARARRTCARASRPCWWCRASVEASESVPHPGAAGQRRRAARVRSARSPPRSSASAPTRVELLSRTTAEGDVRAVPLLPTDDPAHVRGACCSTSASRSNT